MAAVPEQPDQHDDTFTRCQKVFERIGKRRGGTYDIRTIPEHERVVVLVWHSNGIIENGGFQYLFEHQFQGDPQFALTIAAFKAIGCVAAVDAFVKAFSLFPGKSPPKDLDKRLAIYEAINGDVQLEINRSFFSASDDITTKLASYINEHRLLFERTLG